MQDVMDSPKSACIGSQKNVQRQLGHGVGQPSKLDAPGVVPEGTKVSVLATVMPRAHRVTTSSGCLEELLKPNTDVADERWSVSCHAGSNSLTMDLDISLSSSITRHSPRFSTLGEAATEHQRGIFSPSTMIPVKVSER
jgi:hypothetical protein